LGGENRLIQFQMTISISNTSATEVRVARDEDLPAVEALLAQADLPVDGVRDFFPANYAVAEVKGVLIGAAGVEQYSVFGLLRSAVVAADARSSGLGASLVRERLAWSKERGITDVYLLTTTAPRFFEKFGFAHVDRATVPSEVQSASEFASVCPSTATVMHLTL
jgi:amino-acid N-acetyltransferase